MSLTIKRPEKVVSLCLDASLRAEWEAATARLADLMKRPADGRMTGNAEATALAAEVGDLEERMAADTARFRVRGLPRNKWAAHVAAHPPRKDDPADAQYQINTATFFDAVLAESIVDVEQAGESVTFDGAKDWLPLADDMTNGQYGEFVDAVLELNKGAAGIPFSRAAASLRSLASSASSD